MSVSLNNQLASAIKRNNSVNVKDFLAKGDGISDDTLAIQTAINSLNGSGIAVFPEGRTYRATNVIIPSGVTLKGEGGASLKALSGGSAAYFVGTYYYANNTSLSADNNCQIDSLLINANNLKGVAVGWRCYYGRITKSRIVGGTSVNLLITTLGVSGASAPNGTMVNNKVIDNWIGGDADYGLSSPPYAFKVEDPAQNKATDIICTGNYISNATTRDAYFDTCAGLVFQNNHCYGAGVEFRSGFMGFSCSGNYFENDVVIDQITSGVAAVKFGPGNHIGGNGLMKFGNNSNVIVSLGNRYANDLRHCYNDSSKILVTIGDIFDSSDPIKFYQNDGVTTQSNSAGIVKSVGSYLAGLGMDMTTSFSGPTKAYAGALTTAGKVYVGKTFLHLDSPATTKAVSLAVQLPDLTGDGPPAEIEISLNSRDNYSGTPNVQYLAKGTLTKKWDGTYYFTMSNIVYTAGQWSVAPAFAASLSGSTLTVTFTGTYNGDGSHWYYGGAILKATV
jgi:hypothetical protein